jgi:hypothetical protein
MVNPKFDIGNIVYYALPDGQAGIVLDIRYSFKYRECSYYIGWSPTDSTWCSEKELTLNKIF